MIDLYSFVGLPFVAGGRTRAGVDCWGLVRLYLQELHHCHGLPLYDGVTDVKTAMAEAMGGDDWVDVATAPRRAGDVVVMNTALGGGAVAPLHVGVMVNATHVLHVDEGRRSAVEALASPSIRVRLHGLYRHASMAHVPERAPERAPERVVA